MSENQNNPAALVAELTALKAKCLKQNGKQKPFASKEGLARIAEIEKILADQLTELKKTCLDGETGQPFDGVDEADLVLIAELSGILDSQTEQTESESPKPDEKPAEKPTEEPEPTAEDMKKELAKIKKYYPKKWIRAAVRVMRDFANGVPEDKRHGILGDCVKEAADLIKKSKAILGS